MKIPKPCPLKKKPKGLRKKRKGSPELKRKAWQAFSAYIRKRDNYVCFTCLNQLTKETSNAGHFIHGITKPTYFLEDNVHCQCVKCNLWLNGNLVNYTINMISKYGIDRVKELQSQKDLKIWKRSELETIINNYKNKQKDPTDTSDNEGKP